MNGDVRQVSVAPAIVEALCCCHPDHRSRCSLCQRVNKACADYCALAELGADVAKYDPRAFVANSLYPINALTGRPA